MSVRESLIGTRLLLGAMLNDGVFLNKIQKAVSAITMCYKGGGKVIFIGNGGSAADAQHLAAELTGRFRFDRDPLPALALTNTSHITAVANDYSYDDVFLRYVKAHINKGDVVVGISTSGNSSNIVKVASEIDCLFIGLTGKSKCELGELSDIWINVPSTDTPRIQEAHIAIGHAILEEVERVLFDKND